MCKRRVGFNYNIMATAPLDDIPSSEPGMDLPPFDANLASSTVLDVLVQLVEVMYSMPQRWGN
jgi:hypothetical protein